MTEARRTDEWPGQAPHQVLHGDRPLERAVRSLGSLVGCLIAAAVLAVVPLFHIPWVLGWSSAGIYFAVRWAREDMSLLGARGECPRCHAAATFTPGGRATAERRVHCPHCREQLSLTSTPRRALR